MPWRAGLLRARSITVRSARSRHWRSSAKSACSSWPLRWRNHLSVFRTNASTLPTARALARSPAAAPPHAIGDDHEVPHFLGELRLAFSGQAGLAHLHGLGEPGDQEMILIVAADFAGVGQGTELDAHPRRLAIGDSLVLTGRVVERGKRVLQRHRRGPLTGTLSQLNAKTQGARVRFQRILFFSGSLGQSLDKLGRSPGAI